MLLKRSIAGVLPAEVADFWQYFRRETARIDLLVTGRGRGVRLQKGLSNMRAINLADRLSTFNEHWQPRTVCEFNGHDVMLAKLKGEFVWHRHDNTDDFFFVLKGRVRSEERRVGKG